MTEGKVLSQRNNWTHFFRILSWFILSLALQIFFRAAWWSRKPTDLPWSWDSWILGLRFDLSVSCYGALLLLFFGWSRSLTQLIRPLLTSLIILTSFTDWYYYSYFKQRLNPFAFDFFRDDTWALIESIYRNYPIFRILGISFLVVWASERLFHRGEKKLQKIRIQKTDAQQSANSNSCVDPNALSWKIFKKGVAYLIIALVLGLGARGSLGLFPLSLVHAQVAGDPFYSLFAQNSLRLLHRAWELRENMQKPQVRYSKSFENLEQVLRSIPEIDHWSSSDIKSSPLKSDLSPHIIVFLLESFSAEHLAAATEFFDPTQLPEAFPDQLLFESLDLEPPGHGTIGAISSLLVAMNHLPQIAPWTESRLRSCLFQTSWPQVEKQRVYQYHLVYGGNSGWRDLNPFARLQGYQVHDDNDIRKTFLQIPEYELSHPWGVHDEWVFRYVSELLRKATQPQFIVVLTTTNHPPYDLPLSYPAPKIRLPQHDLIVSSEIATKRLQTFYYQWDQWARWMREQNQSSPSRRPLWVTTLGDHGFNIFKQALNSHTGRVVWWLHGVGYASDLLPSLRHNLAKAKSISWNFDDVYVTLQDLLHHTQPHVFPKQSLPVGRSLLFPASWTWPAESLLALKELMVLPAWQQQEPTCEVPVKKQN